MKRLQVLTIVFICLIYSSAFSIKSDIDSNNVSVDDIPSKKFDWIVFGGSGMTTGGNFGFIDSDLNLGPAMAIGLEIPFTKSHVVAFELYNHFWMCSVKYEGFRNDDYLKISDKVYSQGGLSSSIKVYMLPKSSDFRLSLHLGVVLFSTVKTTSDYNALDVGFGIYYRLSDKIQINLNRRYMIGEFDLGGGDRERTQNLIMLHILYNFKW